MCSPTGNGKRIVSVHCIERFVQWRLRIPEDSVSFFNFFKSADEINSVPTRIVAVAQERYLEDMFAMGRFDEALLAFDRFYEENGLLCLSTGAMMIFGLLHSADTLELSGEAELFLKREMTTSPRLEDDIRYYRFDSVVFVVNSQKIITCIRLLPHQRDVLDAIMYGKPIQPF